MEVQAFVAVMVASNYTYAETTYSQKLEDLVMSHAYFFEFLVVFLS
ncbi:MAG: transposase [Psychrobacter glaciei]|jgi:transposase